jgi:AraC-like DNA-binding protein/plasmid stability protein
LRSPERSSARRILRDSNRWHSAAERISSPANQKGGQTLRTALEQPPSQIDTILAPLLGGRAEPFALPAAGISGTRASPRLRSHLPTVSGWFQGIEIRPGLSMILSDMLYAEDNIYHSECRDFLKFHFRLSGDSLVGNAAAEQAVTPGAIGFLALPAYSKKFEAVRADTHERSITLVCARDFLEPMLSAERSEMPAAMADFVRGRDPKFAYGSAPLPLHLRTLVETLLAPDEEGPLDGLGGLMMEARALELLCAAIRHLTEQQGATNTVSQRDRRRIDDLRAILSGEGEHSHSLAQLSRILAWNETQMMESFRKVTGVTISTYRHRLRMDEALRKLRTTDLSITTVAFDAGYSHSGNFATAFRRTFGLSPREARGGGVSSQEAHDGGIPPREARYPAH